MRLYDVPVPIDNYAGFRALYDEGLSPDSVGTDYLALAVQTFFAQGGKRCYVVRMGDPVGRAHRSRGQRSTACSRRRQAPGISDRGAASPISGACRTCRFSLLPDLPVLHATAMQPIKDVTPNQRGSGAVHPLRAAWPSPIRIVPAAPPLPAPRFTSRRLPGVGEESPCRASRSRHQRAAGSAVRRGDAAGVRATCCRRRSRVRRRCCRRAASAKRWRASCRRSRPTTAALVSSAFLQLAYPWLRTTRSARVLEGLEPPDGALAGVLARNALLRGTFTSATKIPPADIVDLFPVAADVRDARAGGEADLESAHREAAGHALQPVRLHARRNPPVERRDDVSGRSVPAGAGQSPGVGR